MNTCTRILFSAVAFWACMAASSFAQVGSEENLNFVVTDDLLVPPGSYHGNDMVFRNRLGNVAFTATADLLTMERVGSHSFTLLSNGQGGSEALNAKDLEFEMRTGPKLGLILDKIIFGCDLELGYFSIDGYSLSKTIYSDNSPLFFTSPFLDTQVGGGQGIRFDYSSRIHSAEANLRYGGGGLCSLIGGFRYIGLHEQLSGTLTGGGQSDIPFITSNTDNHLYGFQLGAEIGFPIGQKLHVGAIGKAGIFSNQSDLTLYGAVDSSAVGGIRGQLAFAGEVDLIGSYMITNNIALRLGYQAMWLSGVAVAVDQLEMPANLGPPSWHPNSSGSLFYHGGFLGVEIGF